jgi:hypothetical protein
LDLEGYLRKLALRVTWPSFGNTMVYTCSISLVIAEVSIVVGVLLLLWRRGVDAAEFNCRYVEASAIWARQKDSNCGAARRRRSLRKEEDRLLIQHTHGLAAPLDCATLVCEGGAWRCGGLQGWLRGVLCREAGSFSPNWWWSLWMHRGTGAAEVAAVRSLDRIGQSAECVYASSRRYCEGH